MLIDFKKGGHLGYTGFAFELKRESDKAYFGEDLT